MHPRRAQADIAASLADLRRELAGIEREIQLAEEAIDRESAAAATHERRAMNAVAGGDDRAAMAALIEHSAHAEALAALEPDLMVLRAIADECRLAIAAAER
jgi:phage shock protein A